MKTREEILSDIQSILGPVMDKLILTAPSATLVSSFDSTVVEHIYEDKLDCYFWYSYSIYQYGSDPNSLLGYIKCSARFSNGQEGMGDRTLGLLARFKDASGALLVPCKLEAYLRDPIHKHGGAWQEYRSAELTIDGSVLRTLDRVDMYWTSDLQQLAIEAQKDFETGKE
jgi:hypothetical protein